MTNYREILRLKSLGYSQRSIASGAKASRNTVSEVLKKAEQLNITWPLDADVTNAWIFRCSSAPIPKILSTP